MTTNMTKKKRQGVSNMKQLLKSIETVSRMDNFRLNLKNKHSRKTLNVLTFLYGWFPGQVGYSERQEAWIIQLQSFNPVSVCLFPINAGNCVP